MIEEMEVMEWFEAWWLWEAVFEVGHNEARYRWLYWHELEGSK